MIRTFQHRHRPDIEHITVDDIPGDGLLAVVYYYHPSPEQPQGHVYRTAQSRDNLDSYVAVRNWLEVTHPALLMEEGL